MWAAWPIMGVVQDVDWRQLVIAGSEALSCPRAEGPTLLYLAVTPEDDNVLRFVTQLRDRERTSRGVSLATSGLEVLAVHSNHPPSFDAEYPDLAELGLASDK
jgi:hypothetical protein